MSEEIPNADSDGNGIGSRRGPAAASALASDTNIENLGLEPSSTDSTPSTPSTTPPDSSSAGDETTIVGDAVPSLEIIGDFEIHDKLGQGGMGAVYRARQISLDRWVALKILPASLEADDTFVSRFQREARIAASLNHGNLVRVYSSGQADGCHYIAMELVEGETLGQWLRRGALPPMEALRICLDVARALDHGWRHAQLIHRDIKPGNIFLSQEGDVKVGDLGLAKSMGADTTGLTHTGTAMGTPHYISPEQARGDKDLDFHADIYSLGCTLYQMLTGRTPYDGRDPLSVMNQHINAPPPALLKVLPQCPIPLARLVGKMLKKSKRERHASYEELIAQIASVQTLFAPAESPLESTLPPDRSATLLETPGAFATPRSATPVTAPVARTAATPTKKKSPAVLYAGLGIGALVVGAALMFLSPGKDGIRKAPTSSTGARQSASPAPVGSGPGADEATTAVANASTENWQNVLRDDGQTLSLAPGARFTPEGLFLGTNSSASILATARGHRNGAVRARLKFDGARPQLTVRSNSAGSYNLWVKNERTLYLIRYDAGSGKATPFKEFVLSDPLTPGKTYELELRAVGSKLTAKLQGAVLGSAEDTHFTAGAFGCSNYIINAPEPMLESLEFLDLSSATDTITTVHSSEAWQNVLAMGENIGLGGGAQITADGLAMPVNSIARVRTRNAQHDGALRTRMTFSKQRPQLTVRTSAVRTSTSGTYSVSFKDSQTLWLQYWNESTRSTTTVKEFPLSSPLLPGRTFELELWAVGRTLTVKLDGAIVGSAEDDALSSGFFGAGNYGSETALFETLEFLDLDTKPTGSNSGSEPWQNMLNDRNKLALPEGAQVTAQGLTFSQLGSAHIRTGDPGSKRDGAIRVRMTYVEPRPTIQISARSGPSGVYNLAVKDASTLVINSWNNATRKPFELKRFDVSPPFVAGRSFDMELRVVGQTLTAKLDGVVLGSVDDSAFLQGTFGINTFDKVSSKTAATALSYLDLDAAAKPVTGSSSEPWRDMLRGEVPLKLDTGAELTSEGLRAPKNGKVFVDSGPDGLGDAAIRVRYTFDEITPQLTARWGSETRFNLAVPNPNAVRLTRWQESLARSTTLKEFRIASPLQPGQPVELELRTVGKTVTIKFNGAVLGTVEDSAPTRGSFGMVVIGAKGDTGVIPALSFLDLEGK